ncbi:MAG TPA: hypothetical protein VF662_01165 [Allosphingosinicella sp.]|jgi:hypothetical protein
MRAVEKRTEVNRAAAQWRKKFTAGAQDIGRMYGLPVWWHEDLGIWGHFGTTGGRGGSLRDWNAFGQQPYQFRSRIVVEVNQPPSGIDTNLQAVFARDDEGKLWVLHQGRMSVAGSRVTEQDFIDATGLKPVEVEFSDGRIADYHKVTSLDAAARSVQEAMAVWLAQCATARSAKLGADPQVVQAITAAQKWEHGLSPEAEGEFEISARAPAIGRRRHGEVWKALAADLKRRGVSHSNDRVAQYGPDLFTYGGTRVLFEIKSDASAQDIFAGVGQLHIYERLLAAQLGTGGYSKVLVVPEGMRSALERPLRELKVSVLTYRRSKGVVRMDSEGLSAALKS